MSNYKFRKVNSADEAELKFIAEIDNTIPALFDPDFVVNDKMNQDRIDFFKTITEADFFEVCTG